MDTLSDLISKANVKAVLIGQLNTVVVAVSGVCVIVLISCWIAEIAKEGGGVTRRYAACFIGVVLQAIAGLLTVMAKRWEPNLLLFYAQELFTILAVVIGGIALGMNNVVVHVCAEGNTSTKTIACAAHVVETVAYVVIILCLMVNYASSQQRVITFVDKGILDGIKGRSNSAGMQQLP